MPTPQEKHNTASRVSTPGMLLIVVVTGASLSLCALLVLLLATHTFTLHRLSGSEYGMIVAYVSVLITSGLSIALIFRLLVGRSGA